MAPRELHLLTRADHRRVGLGLMTFVIAGGIVGLGIGQSYFDGELLATLGTTLGGMALGVGAAMALAAAVDRT